MPLVKCKHCNKQYEVKPYQLKTTKYCSRSCLCLAKITKVNKNCDNCGKEFEAIRSRIGIAKYCSVVCKMIAWSKAHTIKKNCLFCNEEFSSQKGENKKYCSISCSWKDKAVAAESQGKIGFKSPREHFKKSGKLTICMNCGYAKYPQLLGIHHKDKNPKNNVPSNLLVLCPNCHSEQHMKHIVHKSLHQPKKVNNGAINKISEQRIIYQEFKNRIESQATQTSIGNSICN